MTRSVRSTWVMICGALLGACADGGDEEAVVRSADAVIVTGTKVIEGESMTPSSSAVVARTDAAASGGRSIAFWGNGAASASYTGNVTSLSLALRAHVCNGPPHARVSIDGAVVGELDVTATSYTEHKITRAVASGAHVISVELTNDLSTATCDRNLFLDRVTVASTYDDGTGTGNPFAGAKLYVDPDSDAQRTASEWYAAGRTADAQQMDKLAKSASDPRYFGDWTERYDGVAFYVRDWIRRVQAQGALPVMGAYAILHRDCGSYSAGGFTTAAQYRTWIDAFAGAIGTNKVAIIYETDSLASVSCLSAAQLEERLQLESYAVASFRSKAPNAAIYMDGGHSRWQSPATMIDRLRRAGVANARGFFTNNANFNLTADEIAYGRQISAGLGGKHFIVDTARNGSGPYTGGVHDGNCPAWANPPGRALGPRPSASTGDPLVDAFFWLKQPGGSDAACGPFPAAGAWVPSYALGLAQRAAWSL